MEKELIELINKLLSDLQGKLKSNLDNSFLILNKDIINSLNFFAGEILKLTNSNHGLEKVNDSSLIK